MRPIRIAYELSTPTMLSSSSTNNTLTTNPSVGIKKEIGVCGVANIPNQVYHVATYAWHHFNILLAGPVSVGKTSLVNRTLGQTVFDNDNKAFIQSKSADNPLSTAIRVRQQDVCERDVKATIRLVDAPQFGYSVRKHIGIKALAEYTKLMLKAHKDHEAGVQRSAVNYQDGRIHVCLYFLCPSQSALSNTDIECLQELVQYTNVILVMSKADLLNDAEMNHVQDNCLAQCTQHGIPLFADRLFAITSRQQVNGLLEESLIKQHLPTLIEQANNIYYERYRSASLKHLVGVDRPLNQELPTLAP